jgi:aminoglycoside phosphotransferase (APT) family kinase protein
MTVLAPSGDLPDRLARRLSALAGAPVDVQDLTRLSGGASRETWAFAAVAVDGSRRELILRGGAGLGGVDLRVEGVAMAAAARAGVPVPAVIDVGDGTGALPQSYLLMERVRGETLPRRLLRDDEFAAVRQRLLPELASVLARLHAVPLDELAGVEPAGDALARLQAVYGGDGPPPPGLALGLRWLAENRPEPGPHALVHGDFRLGNLMVGSGGLTAVLDWELVHTGDPLEDLGWLCAKVWRFGSPLPAGGLGTRETLLDAYAAVAGWRPTAAQLHWWEVYGTVQWGLMCRVMADRHLSGAEPSVELAAIGRRACEQEFDTLLYLGLDDPHQPRPDVPERPSVDGESLFGRPTATELVAATRLFLTTDVQPRTTGRTAFHARVAANVLAQVERELRHGDAARIRHRAALDLLGCPDDPALSRAIADGALDERWDDVVSAVRESVRDRLLVANPQHLGQPA